jgi:hypothetical protein
VGRRAKAGALLSGALLLIGAAIASGTVLQAGGLRITVLSQVQPYKLPRHKPAPIAIFVSGHLANAKGGIPPQLQRLTVRVNRHGLFQSKGLPVCRIPEIQPSADDLALERCGDAIIGSGQFWANIVLPDQGAYRTQGRLLIFNGREGNKPLLLAHIYSTHPFATSFVIPFVIRHIHKGPYGTEFSASFPQALGEWGYLDRIKLTLKRKYSYGGQELSYFNAACPAPGHAKRTSYPLAYAEFAFAGRAPLAATVSKTCAVKE